MLSLRYATGPGRYTLRIASPYVQQAASHSRDGGRHAGCHGCSNDDALTLAIRLQRHLTFALSGAPLFGTSALERAIRPSSPSCQWTGLKKCHLKIFEPAPFNY